MSADEREKDERDHGLVIIRVSCDSFREDDVSKSYMYHHNLMTDNTQGQKEERSAFMFISSWAFQNQFDPRKNVNLPKPELILCSFSPSDLAAGHGSTRRVFNYIIVTQKECDHRHQPLLALRASRLASAKALYPMPAGQKNTASTTDDPAF